MTYYLTEKQRPIGPFTVDQLRERGVDGNSVVWNENLSDWTLIKDIPRLCQELGIECAVTAEQSPEAPAVPEEAPAPPENAEVDSAAPVSDANEEGATVTETITVMGGTMDSLPQAGVPYGQGLNPNLSSARYVQPQFAQQQPAQQPAQQPQQPVQQQPQPAQQSYQQPAQHPYQQPQPPYQQPLQGQQPPYNSKVLSIISLVLSVICCCNFISGILAIIALTAANNSTTAFRYGDMATANTQAQQANKFAIWSIVGHVVYPILWFIFLFLTDPEFQSIFE